MAALGVQTMGSTSAGAFHAAPVGGLGGGVGLGETVVPTGCTTIPDTTALSAEAEKSMSRVPSVTPTRLVTLWARS